MGTALAGEASNGDVVQAVAMASAVRAPLIHAPNVVTEKLSAQLLRSALEAVADTARETPQVGRA